jgi:pteridine reductase
MTTDNENFSGRVALITGASGRIGAQTARRLHQSGMKVLIHYRSSKQGAEKLKAELEAERADSVALLQADLLDTSQINRLVDDAVSVFGRLDALINNASSFYATPIGSISEDNWHDLIGSNMKAPLFLSQAAAPHLARHNGCIVNLVDVHGFRPMKNHTVYSMAKAANIMMIKSLARELAPAVRVNGVAPGAIAWPEQADGGSLDEQTQQQILQRVPMQRKGEFDDIARTIRFLVMEATYITGQVIAVDGGRMTQQ